MKTSRELSQLRALLGAGAGPQFIELTDDKGKAMFLNMGGGLVAWIKGDKGDKTKITTVAGANTTVTGTPVDIRAILEA